MFLYVYAETIILMQHVGLRSGQCPYLINKYKTVLQDKKTKLGEVKHPYPGQTKMYTISESPL